ncbi:MAG: DUF3298 and DUF4163 domain-containing protein [Romboutsia sp.]
MDSISNYCLNNPVYISEYRVEKESEFFKYKISYPTILNSVVLFNMVFYNPRILDNINQTIYKDISNFKNGVKKESQEYGVEYKNVFSKLNEDYVKYQYEVYADYKVAYNKNNIISITVEKYEFTGGANGTTYLDAYNYNLVNGKKVKIRELFSDNVDYKKIIDKYISGEIKRNSDMYFEDVFKGINEDSKFCIDNDGLVVYFDMYEISPHSTGIPKFKLKFSEFAQYFRPEYICK